MAMAANGFETVQLNLDDFINIKRCTVVFDNPNSKRINGETDTISVEA